MRFVWFCCLMSACSVAPVDFGDEADAATPEGEGKGEDAGSGSARGGASGPEGALEDWRGIQDDFQGQFDGGAPSSVEDLFGDDWNDWKDWALDLNGEGFPILEQDQVAPNCFDSGPVDEHCANGLDDDCDGSVDEHLRWECFEGCDPGHNGSWACDPLTGETTCQCFSGRECGDGEVDFDEECDPRAPDALKARAYYRPGFDAASEWQTTQLQPYCNNQCELDTYLNSCSYRRYQPENGEWLVIWSAGPETGIGDDRRTMFYCMPGTACSRDAHACLPELGDFNVTCPDLKMPAAADVDEETKTAILDYRTYPMTPVEEKQGDDKLTLCQITCRSDEDCPASVAECYQQRCVVPRPPTICDPSKPVPDTRHPDCPVDEPLCVEGAVVEGLVSFVCRAVPPVFRCEYREELAGLVNGGCPSEAPYCAINDDYEGELGVCQEAIPEGAE